MSNANDPAFASPAERDDCPRLGFGQCSAQERIAALETERDQLRAENEALTGVEASFTFSGWGATLTEGERAVHENRSPNWDVMQEAIGAGDGTLHDAIKYWHTEALRLRAELEMAYAEIREQVAGSKVVFDRDLVNRAKDARPYNNHRIAWELERTAIGDGYYGNALRVAKDIPGLTPEDRSLLDRYATGSNAGTDHVALQALAMRIDAALAAKEE